MDGFDIEDNRPGATVCEKMAGMEYVPGGDMERYKNFLIDATALGKAERWESRFAIYNADGQPTEVMEYRALQAHRTTEEEAINQAIASARRLIDEEF